MVYLPYKFKFVYIFSEHRILPHKTHAPKKASVYGGRQTAALVFYLQYTSMARAIYAAAPSPPRESIVSRKRSSCV